MDDVQYHRDVDAVGGGARFHEVELRLGAIDERDPPRRATRTVPKVVSMWCFMHAPLRALDIVGPLDRTGGLPRVPTRFVQKYTLRSRSETSGAHEAVEGRTGHARDLGNGGLGDAQLEETAADVVLLAVEP